MEENKPVSVLNRVIYILLGVLVVCILLVVLYMYGGGLKLLVMQTSTTRDAFHDYDVVKNFGSGYYAVEFKDLITSAGGMEKRYYRFDLTIETDDKKSAEEMIDVRKQVIAIINGVMSSFPPEELNTEPERNRVKSIIKSEVAGKYPGIAVKDMYFTNFLHD
jgi:flagellar basal body-associated protein FliL